MDNFKNLSVEEQAVIIKKDLPKLKKELADQRKLLTLAKESPNAWMSQDFLELSEMKIKEKESQFKMAEILVEVVEKQKQESQGF